jgi:endoglucanase
VLQQRSSRYPARCARSVLIAIVLCLTAGSAWSGSSLDQGFGLRGFNLGARSEEPLAEKDYADLAAYGATVVRVGVNVTLSPSGATFEMPVGEWNHIETTVAMGRTHGFQVILVLVPLPLGEAAVHWNRPELEDSLVDIWGRVAARFKGNPVIAGYDLLNEPVTPNHRQQPSPLGNALEGAGRSAAVQGDGGDPWRRLAVKMIQAIRAEDADSVIIFQPSPWALPKGFRQLTPLPFSNVVYSFHFYEPHALTHQGLYEHRAVLDYPNEQTSRASLDSAIEPVRAFSRQYGVPIFVGEFSIVRWAPGESAVRYLNDAIELFEAAGWSWAYHAFREYEGWDAELDALLPRGARASRSADVKTIRLLVEKGFSKNPTRDLGR